MFLSLETGPSSIHTQTSLNHPCLAHPLPSSIPVPVDDGACSHLLNMPISTRALQTTSFTTVSLARLHGLTILFGYPRTAAANETVPESWNSIPGARGCTPQACSFRDNLSSLYSHGVTQVFGLSTQTSIYQREAKERLGLQYELLSDERLDFVNDMRMPTFEWEGQICLKRVTMAVEGGKIIHTWYPVFPTNESADKVLEWLKKRGV